MTDRGILVVQPGWKEGDPATIDKTTYQHHHETLREGTHLLFYMKEPVDAIIGEGAATGAVTQTDAELQEPNVLSANAAAADLTAGELRVEREKAGAQPVDHRTYEVPYHVIRSKVETPPIPLATIRARIGSAFSVFDEEWVPLSEEQYDELIHEWERSAP